MELMKLTAAELGKRIQAGEVTAVEAAEAALKQIKERDKAPGSQSSGEDRKRGTDRPSRRGSDCGEGQYLYRGAADDLRIQNPL